MKKPVMDCISVTHFRKKLFFSLLIEHLFLLFSYGTEICKPSNYSLCFNAYHHYKFALEL